MKCFRLTGGKVVPGLVWNGSPLKTARLRIMLPAGSQPGHRGPLAPSPLTLLSEVTLSKGGPGDGDQVLFQSEDPEEAIPYGDYVTPLGIYGGAGLAVMSPGGRICLPARDKVLEFMGGSEFLEMGRAASLFGTLDPEETSADGSD